MLNAQAQKRALRAQARGQRDALPAQLKVALAGQIVRHIQAWLAARPQWRRFGFYRAMGSEVDITPLFAWCNFGSRQAFAPRVCDSGAGLCFVRVDEHTAYNYATGGFQEPQGFAVPTESLDVVFVPGLLFDARGFRLGYGGGHYDRALCKTTSYSVGVGYAAQRVEHLPAAEHDVALHALVDETGLWPFDSSRRRPIASATGLI